MAIIKVDNDIVLDGQQPEIKRSKIRKLEPNENITLDSERELLDPRHTSPIYFPKEEVDTSLLGHVKSGAIDATRRMYGLSSGLLENAADTAENIKYGIQKKYYDITGYPEQDTNKVNILSEPEGNVVSDYLYDKAREDSANERLLAGRLQEMNVQDTVSWEDVKDDPISLKTGRFILEQGAKSTPEMIAAMLPVIGIPTVAATTTQNILEQRNINQGREPNAAPTTDDIKTALALSIPSATLERLGIKSSVTKPLGGIEGKITKVSQIPGAMARSAGVEGGTEFVQENLELIGATQGTDVDPTIQDRLETGLQGAIVGAPMGATIRGTTESVNLAINRKPEQILDKGKSEQSLGGDIEQQQEQKVASQVEVMPNRDDLADAINNDKPLPDKKTIDLPNIEIAPELQQQGIVVGANVEQVNQDGEVITGTVASANLVDGDIEVTIVEPSGDLRTLFSSDGNIEVKDTVNNDIIPEQNIEPAVEQQQIPYNDIAVQEPQQEDININNDVPNYQEQSLFNQNDIPIENQANNNKSSRKEELSGLGLEELTTRLQNVKSHAKETGWNKMTTRLARELKKELDTRFPEWDIPKKIDIENAAQDVNINPTEAQKESGTYKKGHISIQGLPITIENPRGSVRSGKDINGKEWSVNMPAHYGYIKRTKGADGDNIDVYIGDNPSSSKVFIFDQIDKDTKNFDEHKVMIGFNSQQEAEQYYKSAFNDGFGGDRVGAITQMDIKEFKNWLNKSNNKKPVAYKKASDDDKQEPKEIIYNGTKISQILVKSREEGKPPIKKWAVQTIENKKIEAEGKTKSVLGDTIHDTLEEAKKEADWQIKKYNSDVKNKAEKDKKAKYEADKKAKEKADFENSNLGKYLARFPKMQAGKIKKNLSTQVRFSDVGVLTKQQRIEYLHEQGILETSTIQENKIKPMTRTQFNRADQRTQDAHEKRVREAGKKTTYLVNKTDLGKTAYDYANYLISLKGKENNSNPLDKSPSNKHEKINMELSKDLEDVLDIDGNKTGWKIYETDNSVVLVNKYNGKTKEFTVNDEKSGTEMVRARAKAQSYAIDNAQKENISQKVQDKENNDKDNPDKGELIVKNIREKDKFKKVILGKADPKSYDGLTAHIKISYKVSKNNWDNAKKEMFYKIRDIENFERKEDYYNSLANEIGITGGRYEISSSITSEKIEEYVKKLDDNKEIVISILNNPSRFKNVRWSIADNLEELINQETPNIYEKDSTKSPVDKIEDFGEKIHGAKKDLWNKYKTSLSDELPDDYSKITLSKNFPEPKYDVLLENGVEVKSLAIIKAMRDTIPSKPRQAWKLKRWVNEVKTLREFAFKILEGKISSDDVLDKIREHDLASMANKIEMYISLGYPAFTKAKDWNLRFLNNVIQGGEKVGDKWLVSKKGSWGNSFDTKEEAIIYLRDKLETEESNPKKTTKLDIYQVRKTKEIIIGKKVASWKYINLKGGFKDWKEAREYLKENEVSLLEELKKKKEIPSERRTVNEDRIGKDYRKGEDVDIERFANEFGWRGIQFGNYVEQSKRAKDLNDAYDAMLDMVSIINIPPRAVSLDGTLGLAFGARGSGGKNPAKAHYEPDEVVINLTKRSGAGSLGHEWFHALDNYFGKRKKGGDFITNSPYAYQDVREEMVEAFRGINKAIDKTGMKERSKRLDNLRTKDYWSTRIEMSARAYEAYLIHKAKKQGNTNDYLANIVGQEAWETITEGDNKDSTYPYPTEQEMVDYIEPAFDNLFNVMKSKETDKGIALYKYSDVTDSQEFRDWFGNSEVVDEDGKPLILYHGTGKGNFDAFETDITWVSESEELAKEYAKTGNKESIYQLYARAENPIFFNVNDTALTRVGDFIGALTKAIEEDGIVLNNKQSKKLRDGLNKLRKYHRDNKTQQLHFYEYWAGKSGSILRKILLDLGYDSIKNFEGGELTYGLLNPSQVKSINNLGEFNIDNDNIYFRKSDGVIDGSTLSYISKIEEDLNKHAKKIGFPKSNIRLLPEINSLFNVEKGFNIDGAYDKGIIYLALSAKDHISVLNHEFIHALKSAKAFTDKEWSILRNNAKEWRTKYNIDDNYREEYTKSFNEYNEKYNRNYSKEKIESLVESKLDEEAIAHAIQDYEIKGFIARIRNKIRKFLVAIQKVLSNKPYEYKTADDLFNAVLSGDIAKRNIGNSRTLDNITSYSMKDASSILTKKGTLKKVIENKLNRYLSEEANKNYYDRYISETTLKNIGLPPKSNDMVVGDTILWIEPEFSGGYRNATFTGYSWNIGKIIKDSYGKKSGQHTFTIETPDGYTIRKKGRTLMKEYSGVLKPSEDRQVKLDEKHVRGREAKLSALRRWLNEHDESHPAYDDKLRRFREMGGSLKETSFPMYKLGKAKKPALDKAKEGLERVRGLEGGLTKDLWGVSATLLHPQQIAVLYKPFVPVYKAVIDRFKQREVMIHSLSKYVDLYNNLKADSKDNVNAVLELGRLNKKTFKPRKDRTIYVKNNGFDNAIFSKDGDTIELTVAETQAYLGVREAMNKAHDKLIDIILEQYGLAEKGAKNIQDVEKMRLDAVINGNIKDIKFYKDVLKRLEDIKSSKKGGYIPFKRWGEIGISVKNKDGDVLHFERIELRKGLINNNKKNIYEYKEVQEAVNRISDMYEDPNLNINVFEVPKFYDDPATLDLKEFDVLLAGNKEISKDDKKNIRDILEFEMSRRGFSSHFIKAKDTPGYSNDFERAINDYIVSFSSYSSNMLNKRKIETAVSSITATGNKELHSYAEEYVSYLDDIVEEFGKLRMMGFIYYIAGSVGSGLVNASQPYIVTAPWFNSKFSHKQIALEMAKANKDAIKMINPKEEHFDFFNFDKAPDDVRDALKKAYAEGDFMSLATHDAMAISNSTTQSLRGVDKLGRQIAEIIGLTFSIPEKTNRVVTFISAYRLAMQPDARKKIIEWAKDNHFAQETLKGKTGKDFAFAYAELAVVSTQYRVGKLNRPKIARGFGTLVFQFWSFTLQTFELMYNMRKVHGGKNIQSLSIMMFALLAVAGLKGVPFEDDLQELYEKLHKYSTGEDIDIDTIAREYILKHTGSEFVTESIMKGLPASILNMDLSNRIGLGNIIPDQENDVFGVWYDMIIGRPLRASEQLNKEEYEKALAEILPKFAGDMVTAYVWDKEGVRTRRGTQVITKDELTDIDKALKFFGITSANISRKREEVWAKKRANNAVNELRNRYYNKIAKALVERTMLLQEGNIIEAEQMTAKIKSIMEEINRHNQVSPIYKRITPNEATIKRRYFEFMQGATARRYRKQARPRVKEIEDIYSYE